MKNIFTFTLSVFAFTAFLFFNPNTTEAYLSTTQSAVRLTPEYSLFTITYRFGFLNRDTYLPVIAVRGLENGDTRPVVGYEIVTNDGLRVQHGTTTAIVLGNTQIKGNQYFLPAKKNGEFTLLVIYQHEPNRSNIAAQVTSLPFIFETNNGKVGTFLHPHELKGYKTPTLK